MKKHFHLIGILLKLLQKKRQNKLGMSQLLWNPKIIVENSVIMSGPTTLYIHGGGSNIFGQWFTKSYLQSLLRPPEEF